MDKAISTSMNLAKSTKGTHVFEAVVRETAAVTTVYVSKSAFEGKPPPQKITLTIAERK